MTGTALVDRLRERARETGLGPVGIAPVAPSRHAAALRTWLDRGYAASMTWMQRTAKDSVDLNRRFPWARSAIVVAQPYLPYRGDRHDQEGLLPHVARYAVGRDYHATLAARLEQLAAFLAGEAPGARQRVYVDTGPVLERELAARAGLGWFGKSTNLILAGGDSWVLIGEILTSVDLPPADPAPDRCGTCTACIDACPTAAITEPYVVDSNHCISYLTIEHRGPLPDGAASDTSDWLFGCDICQEVCPWNRKVVPVGDADFRPLPELERGRLAEVVTLDEAGFAARYAGTALERPGRAGLVRNALLAAGTAADGEALEAARGALADPDPGVRAAAARALGRDGGGGARRAMARARAAETDARVRRALDEGLG
jgi:epoxyqueuosine reductase